MTDRWFSAERLTRLTGEPHAEGRWIDLSSLPRGLPSKAPMVITDIKQPFTSMMSGKTITSRRHYRDELRAYGCVEVGNEVSGGPATKDWSPDSREIVDDIKRAIEQGPPPDMASTLREAETAFDG